MCAARPIPPGFRPRRCRARKAEFSYGADRYGRFPQQTVAESHTAQYVSDPLARPAVTVRAFQAGKGCAEGRIERTRNCAVDRIRIGRRINDVASTLSSVLTTPDVDGRH